jgi:hypothetical protein
MPATPLRTVTATRYVEPLREGGSLPALMEAEDDGLYVVKLRGAGQGLPPLVAEVIVGELARALDFRMPELVTVELARELARAEPDPEIQELLANSAGVNLGVDFLPGALPFTPAALAQIDPRLAADIVWLDALVTNVDRTPRNPNLLVWHGATWLIDHGAALYRQHGPEPLSSSARAPFPAIAEHVLLPVADSILDADLRLAERALGAAERAIEQVPDEWLGPEPGARRADLNAYFGRRLSTPRDFVKEADDARGQ